MSCKCLVSGTKSDGDSQCAGKQIGKTPCEPWVETAAAVALAKDLGGAMAMGYELLEDLMHGDVGVEFREIGVGGRVLYKRVAGVIVITGGSKGIALASVAGIVRKVSKLVKSFDQADCVVLVSVVSRVEQERGELDYMTGYILPFQRPLWLTFVGEIL